MERTIHIRKEVEARLQEDAAHPSLLRSTDPNPSFFPLLLFLSCVFAVSAPKWSFYEELKE